MSVAKLQGNPHILRELEDMVTLLIINPEPQEPSSNGPVRPGYNELTLQLASAARDERYLVLQIHENRRGPHGPIINSLVVAI